MKKRIMPLLILGLLLFQACNAKHVTTPNKNDQETTALMLQTLESFISDTPYCALIQYSSVDVITVPDSYPEDGYAEEKHIYHAKVLETFRGQQMKNISYIETTEKGEGAHISTEPTVITLCMKNNEFFWVGTGSEYPATKEVIKAARRIGQRFKSLKQSFPDCE